MKNKIEKIIIILIILLLLIIIGIMAVNKLKSNYRNFYKVSNNLVLDESYNIFFKQINIDSIISDINIKKSTDNTTRVIINGDSDYVNVYEKDNELFVEIEDRACLGFCFSATIANVEIYLPENYSNLIKIKNKYGNIVIDKFVNTDFDIDSEYGNVDTNGSDFIKIDIAHGNLTLDYSIMARINSLKGNIIIGEVSDVKILNSSGDITVEKVNEYLSLINDTGDITIKNVNLIKDSFIQNKYGDIIIENTNKIYINANTDLGDVKIKDNFKESELILKIENNNGNIIVGSD